MNQYGVLTCLTLQIIVIKSTEGWTVDFAFNGKGNITDESVISVDILHGQGSVQVRLGDTSIILYPDQQLVHPNFIVLHRHDNISTISVPDDACHYRTLPDQSLQLAADVCDGLHGVIYNGQDMYHIKPLPKIYWTDDRYRIPHVLNLMRRRQDDFRSYRDKLSENSDIKFDKLQKESRHYWNKGKRVKRSGQILQGQKAKIETAVFVDRDLLRYMQSVFPNDTERHLLRFVLAMFNAVQILYHDPSLGIRVDFVLKRLEILHTEPSGLERPSDIDRYLSSFCDWQQHQQPQGHDPLKWDHALMLTGLDLYAIGKSGRISNQVVGLAPVAGMCHPRSSCTVNEGRHFESVFVVAHEIGHNLGMRHDGPTADNDCDPGENIMAPTLGSGRFTWSGCSRRYLLTFLQTPQAKCVFESSGPELDHLEGGVLPGERFDANTQCMLKHGAGSVESSQGGSDTCRDLRCTKERFTWATHPALEGTACSLGMWCRGGRCVARDSRVVTGVKKEGGWSGWGPLSECASGCLEDSSRHHTGSTGIAVAHRRCNNPRPENGGHPCKGSDKRYHACRADQCTNLAPTTVDDFAEAICRRAKEIEKDLTGIGKQRRTSEKEEACTVWCDTRYGGAKSKGWIFPDGTACGENRHNQRKQLMFCIAGKCEEFQCSRNGTFIASGDQCPHLPVRIQARWAPVGPCHSNCIQPGQGLRILKKGSELNIQLCHLEKACGKRHTVYEYSNKVCSKFSEKIGKLSGLGLQLSQSADEPDRSCQVACQDSEVQSRFYLVTGEDGWFPFGTDCSRGLADGKAYCVSGKCLKFGDDGLPLQESQFFFPNIKRKRSLETVNRTVLARLDYYAINKVIHALHNGHISSWEPDLNPSPLCLDWDNPIHVDLDILPVQKRDRHNRR